MVKFSHQLHDGFYYGVDYVNKESKDIFYTTYNIGVTSNGFKIGISFKDNGDISPLVELDMIKN